MKDMEIKCCMYEGCKLFTAALAAAIAGDDSSYDKGPVGLGKYSTKKFSPLTFTGEIGENFLLAKFLLYTVFFKLYSYNDHVM